MRRLLLLLALAATAPLAKGQNVQPAFFAPGSGTCTEQTQGDASSHRIYTTDGGAGGTAWFGSLRVGSGESLAYTIYDSDATRGLKVSQWLYGSKAYVTSKGSSGSPGSAFSASGNTCSVSFESGEMYLGAVLSYVTYTVRFDGNGGSGTMQPLSAKNYDESTTLPGCSFTREGYDFAGWKYGGTAFSVGDTVSGSTFGLNHDDATITLVAQWRLNSYPLTLTKGTGIATMYYKVGEASAWTSTTASTTVQVDYGATWYAYAVAASGYTYTSTSQSSPQSGVMKTSGAAFSPSATPNKYTLTLTKGTGIATIYYKANGASSYTSTLSSSTTVQVNYGTTWYAYALPASGYSYTGTSSSAPASGTMGTGGATFSPTATPNAYTVTFNPGEGTVSPTTKSVTYDSQYGTLPVPKRTGYSFAGWYTEANGGTLTTESTIFRKTEPQTLFAHWTANTYTVTLGKNGGTGGNGTVTATYGQPMPRISVPTKAGYTFEGYWTSTGTGGVKYYNADGTSAHDWDKATATTLWAKWAANKYKVTFGKNGGTGGDNYVTATYGQAMPTPRTAPTKTGYTFDGYWDTLSDGGRQYYDGSMSSVRDWDKTTATTLWAKWTANSYTVTLGKNDGEGGDSTVTATYGQAMPTISVPTRTGYVFEGYWTSTGTGGVKYYNADGTSAHDWDKAMATTLWAKWTVTTYTVTLGKNGGTGGTNSVSATYGQAMPTISVPTKKGYTFEGYWTSTGTGGVKYYNADGTSAHDWDKATATTLWAKWAANKYKVTFGKNGGTGGDNYVTATYGQAMPTPRTAPTKTGYTFDGYWDTLAEGGRQYYDGSMNSDTSWDKPKATTLWAKWTANTYTIAFDPNGGKGKMADMVVKYDVTTNLPSCTFAPPAPGAEFWDFAGWSNLTANVFYESGAEVSNLTAEANGVVKLFAQWSDMRNDITKAIDCSNLIWTNKVKETSASDWTILSEPNAGDDTDSCVTNVYSPNFLLSSVVTNGELSFSCKCTGVGIAMGRLTFAQTANANLTYDPTTPLIDVPADGKWHRFTVNVERKASGTAPWYIFFQNNNFSKSVMHIDRVTWVPEGSSVEPTEEDARDISEISFDGGALTLSFTNADERFNYNLRGTNTLGVALRLWPVLWTTNGTGNITITAPVDPSEPKFFYYLETTAK